MYYVGWNDTSVTPNFKTIATSADIVSRANAVSGIVNMGSSGNAAVAGQNPSSLGTLTATSPGNLPLLNFQ
jgi:hypothetical protein